MKVESKHEKIRSQSSTKTDYFVILSVTNKRYRVLTNDIKKLYKVEKKRVPHVPRF